MNSISAAPQFPNTRMRRLRQHPFARKLVRETHLTTNDLIYPLFVIDGKGKKEPIPSMPGVFRFSLDILLNEVDEICDLNIPAIALFPVIDDALKTEKGEYCYQANGLLQNTLRRLKQEFPHLGLISDVALDPYTLSGQDGIVDSKGNVLNDETVSILVEQALSLAEAGADVIAPSDMMDGRILAIREALEANGFYNTLILSYSAKYASSLYGPFRNAVRSDTRLGAQSKESYQMDVANQNEALREVALDLNEGADMVMVKPGLPYLDVVHCIKKTFLVPTFVYQVSGEYSMIKASAACGWCSERKVVFETLIAMKRAGADGILTYFAKDVAKWLKEEQYDAPRS